jgi:hypothetical protein
MGDAVTVDPAISINQWTPSPFCKSTLVRQPPPGSRPKEYSTPATKGSSSPFCEVLSPGVSTACLVGRLGAQHIFDLYPCRYLVSRLPTGCQGRLLGRLVRLSVTNPPRPLLTQFDILFSSRNLRNGAKTCNGLSNTAHIMLGVVICTYRPTTLITCVLTQTPSIRLEPPPCMGRTSPRHSCCDIWPLCPSQTVHSPGQSSLLPTDAAGNGYLLAHRSKAHGKIVIVPGAKTTVCLRRGLRHKRGRTASRAVRILVRSPTSDPAQNPYWKWDFRRAYPQLSMVTQPRAFDTPDPASDSADKSVLLPHFASLRIPLLISSPHNHLTGMPHQQTLLPP